MSTRATTEQLLAALDRIDVEGEGAARQAGASGWEAAWQSLAGRYLRTVGGPGVDRRSG